MEFVPICLECNNFKQCDKCQYYKPIPQKIKNREVKCPHFFSGDYELFIAVPKNENHT